MRVISIILGILLVVGGMMSIISPDSMARGLALLMGLFILIHGVGSLVSHYRFRNLGDGWGVSGAILSVILGALLMTNGIVQWIATLAVVFIAGLWMLAAGIACMATAVKLARAARVLPWERPSLGWLWLLFLGLLLVILGVLAYVHPVVSALTIGALMGVYVISAGVHLIGLSCCPSVR